MTDHKENETQSLNWWCWLSEKADTQFSKPRVHCPEECSKAKEVENYQYTSVPMEKTIAQYLRGSRRNVWRVQGLSSKNGETRAGRTIWPIVRASKVVDDNTYTFDRRSCTRKSIAKVQRTSGKAFTTKSCDQIFVLMQDSWLLLKSDSTSWQRTLKSFHNLQNKWPVVSTPCQETKMHLNQKVGSEGTPNCSRIGSYNLLLAR